MKKQIVEYELSNETAGQVRILAADKIAFERHCRTNGMPMEDGPTAIAFMLYSALKRAHNKVAADAEDFDQFVVNHLVDYRADLTDDDENPTQ